MTSPEQTPTQLGSAARPPVDVPVGWPFISLYALSYAGGSYSWHRCWCRWR